MDCQQIMSWSLLQQCEGASVRFGTHGHGARGKQWEVSTAGIIQNCDPPPGGRMPNMRQLLGCTDNITHSCQCNLSIYTT